MTKRMMSDEEDDTVGDFPAYQSTSPEGVAKITDAGVEISALTHPGLVRSKNEDHFAILRRSRSSSVLASSLPDDELPGTDRAST